MVVSEASPLMIEMRGSCYAPARGHLSPCFLVNWNAAFWAPTCELDVTLSLDSSGLPGSATGLGQQ